MTRESNPMRKMKPEVTRTTVNLILLSLTLNMGVATPQTAHAQQYSQSTAPLPPVINDNRYLPSATFVGGIGVAGA